MLALIFRPDKCPRQFLSKFEAISFLFIRNISRIQEFLFSLPFYAVLYCPSALNSSLFIFPLCLLCPGLQTNVHRLIGSGCVKLNVMVEMGRCWGQWVQAPGVWKEESEQKSLSGEMNERIIRGRGKMREGEEMGEEEMEKRIYVYFFCQFKMQPDGE